MHPDNWKRSAAFGLLLCSLATGTCLLASQPAAEAEARQFIPGRYIVVLRDDAGDPGAAAEVLARRFALAPGLVYRSALRGFSAAVPDNQVAALARDPRVRYVERDQIVSAVGKPGGGSTTQPAQVLPTGINRVEADRSTTAAGNGSGDVNVDIAIIDTGIQPDHPDLNVAGGVNFATGRNWKDGNGHGTHVAGTAAARDNGIGVVGVAPGARLWAVRVLDNNGSGWLSWVLAGVDWVRANAATIEVANMSLGAGYSQSMNDAVKAAVDAGVVFSVAAGNDAADAARYSPASEPSALTVSALADSNGTGGGGGPATSYGADDTFATFSNWGSVVDLIAPGVEIRSTWTGSGYRTISGTSMAAPHVAGAAALYISGQSLRPTPSQVASALTSSAEPAPSPTWAGDPDGDGEPLVSVGTF